MKFSSDLRIYMLIFFFFQAEDGIRDLTVTGVQTCALPIHSWGTPETRYSGVAGNSRQVLGPAPETSLPVVANLSQESRQGLGFCRFLHCPNDCVPTPIRLCDSRSGPQTSDSFRGDR